MIFLEGSSALYAVLMDPQPTAPHTSVQTVTGTQLAVMSGIELKRQQQRLEKEMESKKKQLGVLCAWQKKYDNGDTTAENWDLETSIRLDGEDLKKFDKEKRRRSR